MRLFPVCALLMLSTSTLAAAQSAVPVERRVDSLERQMRSVQRRVFTPGSAPGVTLVQDAPALPATAPTAELSQRIDALERQLAIVTGQVEENGNALRQLDARIDRMEAGQVVAAAPSAPAAVAPAPVIEGASEPTGLPAPQPATAEPDAPSTDPAENAYLAGFRLWEQQRYEEAASTLKSTATQYAKHRRASWARNLLGRAYLDDNKPATAAEAFLANYQELPQGERAADSLYFLGAALMKLNKPEQACKVYDELSDVYGSTMRDYLKQNLPAAKKTAKCRG